MSVFGPWRLNPGALDVFGAHGFANLRFERQLRIRGVRGTPPNLDVVAEGPAGVVAVESKLSEYLTNKKTAKFRAPYTRAIRALAHPTWIDVSDRLKEQPNRFRFLDAAQLVKHYLGIKSQFPDREVTLAYLFWEPEDAISHSLFWQHRAEIQTFAKHLADPQVRFVSASYPELWRKWRHRDTPSWLSAHICTLARRYGIEIGT